ncbi:MAG TPA: hypothetical protein VF337_06255 [Candidatus Limnocylindrales bacterium]
MRPYITDEIEQLRQAHARSVELRSDWRSANGSRAGRDRAEEETHMGVIVAARAVAGRSLIGLGHLIFPGDMEPCSDA